MGLALLAYHGISPSSRVIRWQTLSDVSHVALLFYGMAHSRGDDSITAKEPAILESVPWRGVVRSSNPWEYHRPGTKLDVWRFSYLTESEERKAAQAALAELGKGYDWRGVARFVIRQRPAANNGLWFCSEYFAHVAERMNRQLLNLEPHDITPRDSVASPLLIRTHQGIGMRKDWLEAIT